MLVITLVGCVANYVKPNADGTITSITPEEYAALPPGDQTLYTKVSGWDKAAIKKYVDPTTGIVTQTLEVASGVLPYPYDMLALGALGLLNIFIKTRNIQIARGSKLGAQAIEAVKSLENSTIFKDIMKPILSGGEKAFIIPPIMPDKLLSPTEKNKT